MIAIARPALLERPLWRQVSAATASLGMVGLVTAAIYALEPVAPVLSLGVLYLFAVLPVAAFWGLRFALPVSIASMLAFNWLFLPPRHTFRLADSENWVALAVYLVTAISVSGLAARARRRAAEAEQRQREAAVAAEVSAILLEGTHLAPLLPAIASRVAKLLGSSDATIEVRSIREPQRDEPAYDLVLADRRIGRLFLEPVAHIEAEVADRVVPMLASLLATAIDRERLAREAHESDARRRDEALAADALRRSDAAKTAVLRSVSHDLRSPITAIMTAGEVLAGADDSLSQRDRHELLESILTQARSLERFVSNLLDLSRLEAGVAIPLAELWTIDTIVARALEAIGPENARIDVVLPHDSPPVEVDAAQLEHALANLFENALKFSPATARVEVRAEERASEVVLRVTDHGRGIERDDRERIFEPFSRGANRNGERGSGLGLAIARGFVQVNGGRLWVESEPGLGSTFAVSLPVDTSLSTIRPT